MQNMFQEIIANQFTSEFAQKYMTNYAHGLDDTYVPDLKAGMQYNRTEFLAAMNFGFVDNKGATIATIHIVDCSLGRFIMAKQNNSPKFHRSEIKNKVVVAELVDIALEVLFEALTEHE